MIVFDLRCANGHCFEGWFDSSEDCELQLAQGQITCPNCDQAQVERVPSAVAIKRKALPAKDTESAHRTWREFCQYVQANFEDVGHNFAQEALKLHHGLVDERNIRGVTSEAEEKMLKKEGVSFVKIPMPQQMDS
ncbi:MAG: DUF1178 family protein [Deltaproteobacteria bacterium]|nr:MAG: DUF1178 family protein [Deltaproteobacteria bacterium]